MAVCRLCLSNVAVQYEGKNALLKHASTQKHKDMVSANLISQRVEKFFATKDSPMADKVAASELSLLYHQIKHHQEVLLPLSLENAKNDLSAPVFFSVAMDASNHGNRKLFPVGIKYFNPKQGIIDNILDFYEDPFEDSESVKEQLVRVIKEFGLSWENITSCAADNASVNYGLNKSVFKKLQTEQNRNIIAGNCNDHILHNCAKYALKNFSVDI